MLTLRRNLGERIMIGDDVTITYLGISGSQISLGIDAPEEVLIYREEIYVQLDKEINNDNSNNLNSNEHNNIDNA